VYRVRGDVMCMSVHAPSQVRAEQRRVATQKGVYYILLVAEIAPPLFARMPSRRPAYHDDLEEKHTQESANQRQEKVVFSL